MGLFRISIHGYTFFHHLVNYVDTAIVLSCCMDSFILTPLKIEGLINVSVLRLARISRISRAVKILRYSEHFSEMRILLRTLRLGIRGMFWSVVLLAGLILGGGILMAQLTMPYLEKDALSAERQEWLYRSFGTSARAIYTMFECTFTGGWRFYSRPLIDDFHHSFAFFWVSWIIGVNFTTMRVVAAIFLKQTMAVADIDAERLAMEHLKRREAFASSLRAIFQKGDMDGDGTISLKEFEGMLLDHEVALCFKQLGLDADEVEALFDVLSSDDGEADYEEFLTGALKMNSCARTIDSVQVMHNQLKMTRNLELILQNMKDLQSEVLDCVRTPQTPKIF